MRPQAALELSPPHCLDAGRCRDWVLFANVRQRRCLCRSIAAAATQRPSLAPSVPPELLQQFIPSLMPSLMAASQLPGGLSLGGLEGGSRVTGAGGAAPFTFNHRVQEALRELLAAMSQVGGRARFERVLGCTESCTARQCSLMRMKFACRC